MLLSEMDYIYVIGNFSCIFHYILVQCRSNIAFNLISKGVDLIMANMNMVINQ